VEADPVADGGGSGHLSYDAIARGCRGAWGAVRGYRRPT
jgi:hypothetical protein